MSTVVAALGPRAGRRRSARERVWADARTGYAIVVGLAFIAALVSAWVTPRGPITATEALVSMALALGVGLVSGSVTGSRWSMLVAPAIFIVVFEVLRLGTVGPTVDGIHPGSMYGIIALIVGRGLHGLLVLAPMLVGARLGVEVAARLGRPATARLGALGWGLVAASLFALAGLAVAIAQPGRTAPILGADGQPLAGSVAELATLEVGGHEQVLMIRGRDVSNPVLLYLAGGPGGTDLGAMRADATLEQDFTVVAWDQRGTGKSYAALDPVETLTLDQMIDDTVEVSDYLRDRFDQDRIYLAGNSWGSILGVLTVQQHPERYHAYVGTGQMVSPVATDRMFWEDSLAWAERTGADGLAASLRANGLPPYEDLLAYEPAIAPEHDFNPYPELDPGKEMPFNLLVPENSLMDRFNGMRGFLDTFSVLYPQLQEVDLRVDAPRLEVPVYMVIGVHEARGRALPANEWFDQLQAPYKERFVFEHSGHRPQFEEPAEFASTMRQISTSS